MWHQEKRSSSPQTLVGRLLEYHLAYFSSDDRYRLEIMLNNVRVTWDFVLVQAYWTDPSHFYFISNRPGRTNKVLQKHDRPIGFEPWLRIFQLFAEINKYWKSRYLDTEIVLKMYYISSPWIYLCNLQYRSSQKVLLVCFYASLILSSIQVELKIYLQF